MTGGSFMRYRLKFSLLQILPLKTNTYSIGIYQYKHAGDLSYNCLNIGVIHLKFWLSDP